MIATRINLCTTRSLLLCHLCTIIPLLTEYFPIINIMPTRSDEVFEVRVLPRASHCRGFDYSKSKLKNVECGM